MKELITFFILAVFLSVNMSVAAEDTLLNEIQENTSAVVHNDAPVWADYVAPKYRNPRQG